MQIKNLLIVEENNERGGWGAQVAADVAWQALGYLDAPIRCLATFQRINYQTFIACFTTSD